MSLTNEFAAHNVLISIIGIVSSLRSFESVSLLVTSDCHDDLSCKFSSKIVPQVPSQFASIEARLLDHMDPRPW